MVVRDTAFAQDLRARLVDAMTQGSQQVAVEDYVHRPLLQRVKERIALGLMRLALFLTGFVMGPVLQKAYDDGIKPLVANQITVEQAFEASSDTDELRAMLEAQMHLPEALWSRLNLAWAGFFAAMGGLNLFVAYSFSEDTWVNFKLFGGMGLMLVFVLAQGMVLSRYIEEEPK